MLTDTDNSQDTEKSSISLNRRSFAKGGALTLTAGLLGASPLAQSGVHASNALLQVSNSAFDVAHVPRPLPFNPAKLNGISAPMIESHWQNNYGGSVRALNEINKRLSAAQSDSDLPAFIYNNLKREHLARTGSVILHELYFDNLGGDGNARTGAQEIIGSAFGVFDRWESEFRRIAAGLSGGSGWVLLGYNRHFKTLENYWMADHMHSPSSTVPLLVMDMYEHSYQMDFGAATARYIDAFFANIDWDSVAARIEAIQ